jgi:hypothetical protein
MRRLLALVLLLGLGWLVYDLLEEGAADRRGSADDGDGDAARRPVASPVAGPRCAGVTRSGRRCTRPAEPGSTTCWQHG